MRVSKPTDFFRQPFRSALAVVAACGLVIALGAAVLKPDLLALGLGVMALTLALAVVHGLVSASLGGHAPLRQVAVLGGLLLLLALAAVGAPRTIAIARDGLRRLQVATTSSAVTAGDPAP